MSEDQIERLPQRLAAAEEQIEQQRLVLDDLQQENDRLERILQAPLSLKDLRVAWDAAEQADECQKGDVLILETSGGFNVYTAMGDGPLVHARILSRAPREPRADLADVRVTGGDDDE